MSETEITQAIIHHLKVIGGNGYHVHGSSTQRIGEPDISGEYPVHNQDTGETTYLHLRLEVKTKTGRPSKMQLYRLGWYVRTGYVAGIVTSVEDMLTLIHEFEIEGNNKKSWAETKYQR